MGLVFCRCSGTRLGNPCSCVVANGLARETPEDSGRIPSVACRHISLDEVQYRIIAGRAATPSDDDVRFQCAATFECSATGVSSTVHRCG